MRVSFAIALLLGSASAIKKTWPSVARCAPGQTSTDQQACDQSAPPNHIHNHDNVVGADPLNKIPEAPPALVQKQWPSVARCAPGQTSTDQQACDQSAPPNHIHNHDNVVGADPLNKIPEAPAAPPALVQKQWPSVARCAPGQTSTDQQACDQSAPPNHIHNHDNVVGADPLNKIPEALIQLNVGAQEAAQIVASWPSVARCAPDEIPSDQFPCDHANEFRRHRHDGTLGLDIQPVVEDVQLSYRPPIKCKDPDFGNPITCDLDDISDLNDDHVKNIWNMTPVKTVVGGPTVSNEPPAEPVDEADAPKEAAAKGSLKAAPEATKD